MQKGQHVSGELKARMVETKKASLLAKLNLDAVPEQTKREFVVPSHRKLKRLTSVTEYVAIRKDRGWNTKDFIRDGYSKHQVAFYDFVLQDKLCLSKKEFISDYHEGAMELAEIAKKHGIPAGYMVFLREHFGIKRIGAKGLRRKRETLSLTDRQKDIVIGTTLGDGCISPGGALSCKHGLSQLGYVEWIRDELEAHCPSSDLDVGRIYDDRYERIVENRSCRTRNHAELRDIHRMFYVDGTKAISQQILDRVDELALAVWFMDDGRTEFYFDEVRKATGCTCYIYTCSYSEAENVLMKDWFLRRWGLDCHIRHKTQPDRNPYLVFSGPPAFRLLDIIRPHVIPVLKYKVDPQAWIERKKRSNVGTLFDTPTHSYFTRLPPVAQEEIVERLFQYYRSSGFPGYHLDDEELELSFLRIRNWRQAHLFADERTIRANRNSVSAILCFHPHLFDMAVAKSPSPRQVFDDDAMLKDAIRQRLAIGGTCVPSGLRASVMGYKGCRSIGNFPPSVARGVFMRFAGPSSRVLDFSAGFGSRLAAAMASNVAEYVGIEPVGKTCDGLRGMAEAFAKHSRTAVSVVHGDAMEQIGLLAGQFDLVFSGPPYFAGGLTGVDGVECHGRFESYDGWFDEWLVPAIGLAAGKLRPGGRMVLSLGCPEEFNASERLLSACGSLRLESPMFWERPTSTFRTKARPPKVERLFVFSMPSA